MRQSSECQQQRRRLFIIGAQADVHPPDFPTPLGRFIARSGGECVRKSHEAIADLPGLG